MFSLHVDFGEACGFYSSNNVLRIKCELGGVGIHSVHLLWGFKGERLEEARTGATLQLLWSNPQAFEEINTRKGALFRRENYVWSTPLIPTTNPHGIAPSALSMWSGLVYFFAPDLYPVYPNVLSVFFFIAVASAVLMVIFKKLKYKNHSE